jgi:hypothetical protein
MTTTLRPAHSEYAEYYVRYVDQLPDGDIAKILETQRRDALAMFRGVSEERSLRRYAPGKWSIREMLAHVNDCERLFVFRAMWFARGLEGTLPSFDQDIAVTAAASDARSWKSHIDEFVGLRDATIAFFAGLPDEAWSRRGTASGYEFTVRALAWITAGHVAHHMKILEERYL